MNCDSSKIYKQNCNNGSILSITNKGLKEVTEKQLRNDPSKLIHTVTNKGLVKYQKKTMKVTNQGLVSTEETNSNLSEVDFENKG